MRKYARAEVVEVKGSTNGRIKQASIEKFADYSDYRTDDDYLYVRVRAISSRVNKNNDGWPSEELAKSYKTFVGKPIFVDHHNHDPSKARGVIVDAALHVEEDLQKAASLDPYYASAPDNHKPPTWVELLLEVDAKSFPKLAKSIIKEDIDSVSMGANVERSKCSHCGNVARHPEEYCKHVISKGAYFDKEENGRRVSKKSYEDCYDIGFFEISFVFDPADETALVHDIKQAKVAAAVHAEAGERADYDPTSLIDHMVIRARREYKQAVHEGGDRASALRAALTALREIGADKQQAVAAVQKALATPAQMVSKTVVADEYNHPEAWTGAPQATADPEADPRQWQPGDTIQDMQGRRALVLGVGESGYYNLQHITPGANTPGAVFSLAIPALERYGYRRVEGDAVPDTVPQAWDGSDQHDTPQQMQQMVQHAKVAKTADRRNPAPQDDALTAPDRVDTLRQDQLCPICGSDMEDGVCEVCNYEEPPEGFDNPDLEKAQQVDQQIEDQQAQMAAEQEGQPGPATPAPQQPASVPAAPAPQMMSSVSGTLTKNADGTFTFTASSNENTTTVLASLTVTGETGNAVRLAAQSDNSSGGRVNVNEKPLLPQSRQKTDKPLNVRVEKDYGAPVESSTKGVQMSQKTADGATPHGGADTQADKRVDVTGVGGIMPAGESEHESVEKEVLVEAPATDTWSGTKRQHDPVTTKPSQGKDAYASERAARELLNEEHGTQIDVTKPLMADGMVGDRTKTFPKDKMHVTDPVTTEEGTGTYDIGTNLSEVRSSVKAHVLAAIRLAEQEVDMGLTPAEDKFNRADELEQKSPETLRELEAQLARTKKAGLTRTASVKKSASAGSLPSMRTASVAEHVGSVNPDDGDASGIFM